MSSSPNCDRHPDRSSSPDRDVAVYSAEEKIRIVLERVKGDESIADPCRREGISPNPYYGWSKEFLEAGKKRRLGDTKREASRGEVMSLRRGTTG